MRKIFPTFFKGVPPHSSIESRIGFRVSPSSLRLYSTELGIASCIISRGYETFDSEEGRRLMSEWGVPEGYACQGFVILGYIDGEQPKSKPRKPGRIKIVE